MAPTAHLDGKHVVFGEVIKGKSLGTFSILPVRHHGDNTPLVRQIENYPTSTGDVPTSPIIIANCGVLPPDDPSLSETDGDPFEDYPGDEDRDTDQPEIALEIAQAVREVGNKLFKEGKTEAALEKYQSVFMQLSLSGFQSCSIMNFRSRIPPIPGYPSGATRRLFGNPSKLIQRSASTSAP